MRQLRILLSFAALLLPAPSSRGATAVFRERIIPGPPGGVTEVVEGPVSTVWFTQFDANQIGMLSFDGQFREFAVPTPDSGPRGIATDSQSVWFTEFKAGKIGRLTPDGGFAEYVIPSPHSGPWGIALIGGMAWFTESAANKIGRVNRDGSITEFVIPTNDAMPRGIGGSSFEVCFAEFGANRIGCLENGQILERALSPGSGPQDISIETNRADIWFTESTGNRIGLVHFAGVSSLAQARIDEFPVPTSASGLSGIAAEYYESAAWFTEKSAGQVGFIAADGRVTEYALADRSSQPSGIALSFLGARFLESAANRVVEIQPEAVIVAGGSTGRWLTQVQVANVVPRPVTGFAGRFPRPAGVCAGQCPPEASVSLPAAGSGQLNINGFDLLTFFVRSLEEGVLPSVRARIYNRDLPSQSADIPTIRLSTLTSLNPKTLTFPGALKNGSARSNLLIADASVDRLVIGPVQTTRVRVDLLDSGGFLIASGEFGFVGGGSLYLVDIIGRLGVTTFQDGQIRVTKIGDEGLLWGYLATVNSDGAVSIFSGLNP